MRHRREYNKALIGKNLKRARERQGLTVEDVREYLCLGSVQAIYKYEAGLSYPTADTLLALMELYHIDRVDLLCRQLAQRNVHIGVLMSSRHSGCRYRWTPE